MRSMMARRSVEALRADPEIAAALAKGAVLAMVPLLLDAGRAVRANLSPDAGLLDAIDEAAKAHGLTRSAFLASAAREKIEGSLPSPRLTRHGLKSSGHARQANAPRNTTSCRQFTDRRPAKIGGFASHISIYMIWVSI